MKISITNTVVLPKFTITFPLKHQSISHLMLSLVEKKDWDYDIFDKLKTI